MATTLSEQQPLPMPTEEQLNEAVDAVDHRALVFVDARFAEPTR